MKTMVVAYDQARAIGANGDLPWGRDLPADLRHFRELTLGRYVIMGRATYESIGSEPLPDRINILLSHTVPARPRMFVARNIHEALAVAADKATFIGGAAVYAEALAVDAVDEIHATEVYATFAAADTFFPKLDDSWVEQSRERHAKDERNAHDFDFVTYRKIR
jgi:dihydrofolate reductase